MRKLTKFKIGGTVIPVYTFEWTSDSSELATPEVYKLQSVEAPDPMLLEKAHAVGVLASRLVCLSVTGDDAYNGAKFYAITFDYPLGDKGVDKDSYTMRIRADMSYPWQPYTFTYTTPKWRVQYSNAAGDYNNEIRNIINELLQECWKYIDGERAQVKLGFDETEN